MRLCKAKVTAYRSIRDTGDFEIEPNKSILAGPNEAGKTAVLQALQQINPPAGVKKFDALRDYPRALYNDDIASGKVDPSKTTIVVATFVLEASDKAEIPSDYHQCTYTYGRYLNNSAWYRLDGGPQIQTLGDFRKDLIRLANHADKQFPADTDPKPSDEIQTIIGTQSDRVPLQGDLANTLQAWLNKISSLVDEGRRGSTG
jgi:predicted ATP-binding protein involved in virulence